MRRVSTASVAALTLALAAACGNPDGEDDPVPADTLAATVDTSTGPIATETG